MKEQTLLRQLFGRFDVGSHAAFFGKWMWVYFWMNFAMMIPSTLMDQEDASAMMLAVGGVLNTLFVLFSACLLLIMGLREERFGKSGMVYLVCAVVGYGVSVLNQSLLTGLWSTVGAVLELVAEYHFFQGCASILEDFDPELAGKWRKLWKWYLIVHVGSILGLVSSLVLLNTDLLLIGALTTMVLGIALLAVLILVLVYQYKTAQTFRKITKLQNS